MRTLAGGGFQYAGAQPLAAHFHEAEARNAADLDAGAIVLERLLHRLFDLTDVGVHLHVDKVDDDEARHVAQAQLTCDFARGFQVGCDGGLLDAMFARRPAGVDVDRHQRLGRVDDQIAARFELDDRVVHRRQLILDTGALEQRDSVGILLHAPGMARHQQLHEVLGGLVAILALDDDFLDILVVDVADGALDQIAVIVDQLGRRRLERLFADLVPQPREIIEVALDFGLGALKSRRANDAAHGGGQVHLRDDGLQPLAIGRVADLAADAAAMRRVGHEHAIAARQRQICGQRRTLVAALFLDDLHQQHLAALDDVLDLVTATQGHALATQFVRSIVAILPALAAATLGGFGRRALGIRLGRVLILMMMSRLDQLDPVLARVLVILDLGAQRGLFLGMGALFLQQRLTVLARDLIIIGVNFAESQETVTVAAIIDEGGLERRLHARHFGEIDIALELLVLGRFEIELLDPVTFDDRDPGFFPVARIDQHTHCHL